MMRLRFQKLFADASALPNRPLPQSSGIEIIAEHITQFSLAGIKEIRRRIEAGEYGGRA
jgi:hypothetical protein